MLFRGRPLSIGVVWLFVVLLQGAMGVVGMRSSAQVTTRITPDGVLGTTITQNGRTYEITGGTRPMQNGVGPNLFHGFEQFSIGTNDAAHFVGRPGVENIIGRVTGEGISEIDGRLSSDATLFLINPSGMVFGPNASLDVQGSFHASTADELRLEGGGVLKARLTGGSDQSVLTIAPPVAFGFLQGNPRGIAVNRSNLSVPDGETLSLVGGNITMQGGRSEARGGTLHLASVASVASEMAVPLAPDYAASDLIAEPLDRLGDITTSDGVLLNTSGSGGGKIVIRSGKFVMSRAAMTAENFSDVDSPGVGIDVDVTERIAMKDRSSVSVVALRSGRAGAVALKAAEVAMESSSITTRSLAAGAGGDVTIDAGRVLLTDETSITSNTVRDGPGGEIRIRAEAAVTISGNTQLNSTSGLGGAAGHISIRAGNVSIVDQDNDFSQTGIFSRGLDGAIRIIADDVSIANGVILSESPDQGRGGVVDIRAQRVALSDGASVNTTVRRSGEGGGIRVTSDRFTIENATVVSAADVDVVATDIEIVTGLIVARSSGGRPGGDVTIRAQRMSLAERASINTVGRESGDVIVNADQITIQNASISSNSSASPGNVRITADDSIVILEQADTGVEAGIFSFGGREQMFGEVDITASRLEMRGGTIGTPSQLGPSVRAGNVTVNVDTLILRDQALINTSTASRENAGTVTIHTSDAMLTQGSTISAGTVAAGHAGDIDMTADRLTLDGETQITSETTGAGNAGTIRVVATEMNVDGGSSITTSAGMRASGRAGDIDIAATRLMLNSDAQITSETAGTGDVGRIQVVTTDMDLDGGSRISTAARDMSTRAQEAVDAGDIAITANRLVLQDGAQITSESFGAGNAGAIDIGAETLTLREGSKITTESVQGNGGNITIASERVVLQDSAIRTDSMQGGAGGNIRIAETSGVVALLDSAITTSAEIGQGGNITIGALLVDAGSLVDASGGIDDGEVELGTVVNLGAITPLPQSFAADVAIFNEPCAQRLRGGDISSFVASGRDGLPADPSGALPSLMMEVPEEDRTGTLYGPLRVAVPGDGAERDRAAAELLQAMHAYHCSKKNSRRSVATHHTP